jgi:uncharacterized RDD family membrane protein YckC
MTPAHQAPARRALAGIIDFYTVALIFGGSSLAIVAKVISHNGVQHDLAAAVMMICLPLLSVMIGSVLYQGFAGVFFDGRTLGKYITGLKVITLTPEHRAGKLFARGFLVYLEQGFSLGLSMLYMLLREDGKRPADFLTGTAVVQTASPSPSIHHVRNAIVTFIFLWLAVNPMYSLAWLPSFLAPYLDSYVTPED